MSISSTSCAVDGPGEAVLHEARGVARVVDVGVGQDEVVQKTRLEARFLPVQAAQFLEALEEPAVHEDALAGRFQEMPAAGDRAGGAVEG